MRFQARKCIKQRVQIVHKLRKLHHTGANWDRRRLVIVDISGTYTVTLRYSKILWLMIYVQDDFIQV